MEQLGADQPAPTLRGYREEPCIGVLFRVWVEVGGTLDWFIPFIRAIYFSKGHLRDGGVMPFVSPPQKAMLFSGLS